MSIEETLKKLILDRYGSIREFTQKINIPYSTFDTILRRGIQNATVHNVILICNALHISADELADGRITPTNINLDIETRDISADYQRLIAYIKNTSDILFDGEPAKKETLDAMLISLETGLSIAKKIQK